MPSDKKETSSDPDAKHLHAIMGVALISQVCFWLFGSPGTAFHGLQFGFPVALHSVLATFVCVFVFPLITCKVVGIKLTGLGLQLGHWKFGLIATLVAIPLAAASLYGGCNHPEILEHYPRPGIWLSESVQNMLLWFAIYGLYYFAYEFFYRGFVMRGLENEIGLTAAIWIQAIMSAMVHFGKPTPELLAAIPAGFLFAWLALKTRSILYVFLVHWAIGILNDLFTMHYKDWI